MKHDKQRDLARMVLPSRAAKMARDKSRQIHRQERHQVSECLATMHPEDEWEDARRYPAVNRAEGFSRSEMKLRVEDRRGADNLGALRRWAEHQQRQCKGDDARAYEKCEAALQPGKNLITRHAMEHVAGWLDAPQARFYRPMMNERDLAAEQEGIRRSMQKNYGSVILTTDEMRSLVMALYTGQHAALNKILKRHNLMRRSCTKDDPCTHSMIRKVKHYFIYNAARWQKWERVGISEWEKATREGQRGQVRLIDETVTSHDIQKCPNRIIIRGPSDMESLMAMVCSEPMREGGPYSIYSAASEGTVRAVRQDIMKLAERAGLR